MSALPRNSLERQSLGLHPNVLQQRLWVDSANCSSVSQGLCCSEFDNDTRKGIVDQTVLLEKEMVPGKTTNKVNPDYLKCLPGLDPI